MTQLMKFLMQTNSYASSSSHYCILVELDKPAKAKIWQNHTGCNIAGQTDGAKHCQWKHNGSWKALWSRSTVMAAWMSPPVKCCGIWHLWHVLSKRNRNSAELSTPKRPLPEIWSTWLWNNNCYPLVVGLSWLIASFYRLWLNATQLWAPIFSEL